ncbi:methylated-DNA--[protein]-cysteine S-methyltransferase [Chondromyces crocatus]|uniref:Methylated-DNA--protein-cysteine methyltransferase n=1 Tax=Chondromyces crocatus TaxID=52 RepID=A0A0K1ENM8_CHOCO|nr:methylated-DNA--[protein]-cysteine S-methyltransferase [Chondromyces crocatus]AKT42247.1 methylated-DNA--protein-cysteine methyltransferase [Chondromyces crocatus]
MGARGRKEWVVSTALGPLRLRWSEQGLTGIRLLEEDEQTAGAMAATGATSTTSRPRDAHDEEVPDFVREAAARLAQHVAGEPQDLTGIPLDMRGLPDFHVQIYEAARRVGPGQTTTYGELAKQVGAPGSARAVGQAMAKNPFIVVMPCHRVLAAGQQPGGFSAPGGLVTKERLLRLEGAHMGPQQLTLLR